MQTYFQGRFKLRSSGMTAIGDELYDRAHIQPYVLNYAPGHAGSSARATPVRRAVKGPVVVIDNYDSFTYNLCQVI